MVLTHTSSTFKKVSSFLFGFMLLGCAAKAEIPSFVRGTLYSANAALVSEVVPTLSADVVLLKGGLEQGLRLGMVCRVSRGTKSIGELVIIESRSKRAAGLILKLDKGSVIQTGDIAQIKTLQNS